LVRGPDGFCIECRADEPGELLGYLQMDDQTGLKSFKGYYGDKKATDKKIARDVFKKGDAYFRTGDLLKISRTGHFYFVDRTGDTFRFRGENVATTEVAEVLSRFEEVAEVNIYGAAVPGVEGRAGMAAFVPKLPHSDGHKGAEEQATSASTAAASATQAPVGYLPPTFNLKAFAAFAKKNLPSYAVPVFLRVLPEVPVTSTFKHLKKELRDEGADPTKVADPLYWLNPESGEYEPLTPDVWFKIVSGHSRL
jgi:fatty-acyl-CoA synthase